MSVVELPSGPRARGDRGRALPHVRVAIVGAGFSGLGLAIRLKQAGIEDFVLLERAHDVGGTWQANTYPGCQCDIPSHLYSFSFAPNPAWSRTYSCQDEIRDYLRDLADRHALRPHIRFGHELSAAAWEEEGPHWRVETSRGAWTAQLLVDATGPLSHPRLPAIDGLETFAGTMFHSAAWNHDHDLGGERVAVIGTGASAIQFVPKIAERVARLHVFQRTPPWVLPHTDRPITRVERRLYGALPLAQKAVRGAVYVGREATLLGFLGKEERVMTALEKVAAVHLRRQVRDPELRAKLTPSFRVGCKRILVSNDWYPALTRPNVEVVGDAIRAIRGNTIVLADGSEREVDTLILGTGFHVTDPPTAQLLRGSDDRPLSRRARRGIQAYLGTTIPGLPNFFKLIGPNTGLGHSSMVYMIESQLRYVLDALRVMDAQRIAAFDVRPEVAAAYNAQIQAKLPATVWASGCASWYLDAWGRNVTIWPDFTFRFRRRTRRFDPRAYVLRHAVDSARARARRRVMLRSRYDVAGRTVFVTGAARGIGAGAAQRLHAAGANVALVGLEPERLAALARRLGPRAAWFEADVTDPDALRVAVEGTVARFGAIDVAIANAGVNFVGRLATVPREQVERTLEVNLLGVWRTDRAVLDEIARNRGYLLNVSSLSAALHAPLMGAYSASKAGVEALTDCLRVELAPSGARVGCAYFGFVDTDLVRGSFAHPSSRALLPTMPGFIARPAPLELALDTIERAVARRAARAWAPRFVGGALALRGIVQPLTEWRIRASRRLPRALALADRVADAAPDERQAQLGVSAVALDEHPDAAALAERP